MMAGGTLLDKIWARHVVRELEDGWALLHVDRHLLHDLSGPMAFEFLERRGLPVHTPELAIATPDHAVPSAPGAAIVALPGKPPLWEQLRLSSQAAGIRFFGVGEQGQGIVHIIGPELGLVLPGCILACGDSHTCTNGALGALAIGIGASEVAHVLATQTLWQQKPRNMRIRVDGALSPGCTPKDLALALIGWLGTAVGAGHGIEFTGPAVDAMSMEGRLTLCNLAAELGAKIALVAPDETTFAWLQGRRFSPRGDLLQRALADWRLLRTDPDAAFEREFSFDARGVQPTITWGTSPQQAIAINALVPEPKTEEDRAARAYMGLQPGVPIAGTPVDRVFIGSCANARLSDLREAAAVLRGRRVAAGVTAWVVPGSEAVRREAEAEGLGEVFQQAGFEWRSPSCSMCSGSNGDKALPHARCVSTSNRNYVGRQGPEVRTHLASPAMAAAAAVCGAIVDPRSQP